MKFKYSYQINTLEYHKEDNTWNEPTEQFVGNFESQGFKLNNGWITFTIYEKKIRVFAKLELERSWEPTYFRKDLPKQNEIIFTFSEQDEIEKINGKWGKKHA